MTRSRARSLLAVATLAVTGCTGGATVDATLQVVAPDNHVRAEGAECNGARPFSHVRNRASYTIEGPDGTVVAEGELTTGRAVNADPDVDWGDLERIPTVCVIELDVRLPDHPRYLLRVGDAPPLGFERAWISDAAPVVLVAE